MATNNMNSAISANQVGNVGKMDPISLPGFGPSLPGDSFDPMKYSVKYMTVDFGDVGSIADLERIETLAIRNQGVYILSKEKHTFLEKAFLIVGYLVKDAQE